MITGIRRIIASAAVIVTLQFSAAAAAESPYPVPEPAEQSASGGPALWEVSDRDTTIYLFGTIHFLPGDVDWFSGPIETALRSSNEVVTELDPQDAQRLPGLMQQTAFLPEGQILREMLSPDDRKKFEELLITLGIPIEQFDRYKPWAAGLTLSVLMTKRAGFDPEKGAEEVVEGQRPQNARRSALETVDFQVDLFAGLPEAQQIAYLNQVVETAPRLKEDLTTMLKDWLDGDADSLGQLINSADGDPALNRRMLTDRNVIWSGWIKDRLRKPGTVFIAVGAGHLAGKGSVLDQLRKRGIRSKRVN
ncbi:TraB/GumN family protein [Altererythrobacter sp. CC-YST694]|uniref:TraB/GumN family protein n=1 Tax=Altererythrobacter sp. CC-YST694 TaxID=2755038 RepID=UPI001D003C4C|nr:TraB/GumN family protein [Altererythrobacter sp. CC-YST694]MCB5424448.1 TraB/GumN family protein [Altererythrobacter sp. CC-YST694]